MSHQQYSEPYKPLGEFVDLSMDDLLKVARAAHMPSAPIFLKHPQSGHMIIQHTHGFYAYVEHLDGSGVLLFAHDLHLFDPITHKEEPFFDFGNAFLEKSWGARFDSFLFHKVIS